MEPTADPTATAPEPAANGAAANAALDALINDTAPEPVEAAPAPEATGAELAPEAEPEQDWLDVDDTQLDTKLKWGENPVTLRELREAYESRTMPEVLAKERQEVEAAKKAIEDERSKAAYVKSYDIPHKFLTEALRPMVEKGTLPPEIYTGIQRVFAEAIETGVYDPKSYESKAAEALQRAELEKERKALQTEARNAQLQVQVATVIASYPELAQPGANGIKALRPEASQKILDYVKGHYSKTGQLLDITEAAAQLVKTGAFAKPQQTRKQLADHFRKQQPAKTQPKGSKLSKEAALNNFYQN
jgi:hypothetical protein